MKRARSTRNEQADDTLVAVVNDVLRDFSFDPGVFRLLQRPPTWASEADRHIAGSVALFTVAAGACLFRQRND